MTLTPEQLKAATLIDKSVAVVAGAGSGKTRVLTEHFRELVSSGVPVCRIVAFTFTEKAAAEIRGRLLADEILKPEEEVLCEIGTLHSFCARLLKKQGSEIGLDPSFSIAGEAVAQIDLDDRILSFISGALSRGQEPIATFCRHFGFNRIASLIRDLLDEPRFPLLSEDSGLNEVERNLLHHVREFSGRLSNERIESATLSFDDLERLTLRLLSTHPGIAEKTAERFLHILVDEFQDTNPIQGTILSKIHVPGKNHLFIVGDPRQSIYRFRRADVSLFREWARQIKKEDGELVVLSDSFRLAPELVGPLNKVFGSLFGGGDNPFPYGPMTSRRETGRGKFCLVVSTGEKMAAAERKKAEASFLAERMAPLRHSEEELGETAILFRSGEAIPLFRDELFRRGIPCRVTRTEDLFTYPEIRDLLHLMAFLGGDRSRLTLAGVLRSPFFRFSEFFIERFLLSKAEDFFSPFHVDLFTNPADQGEWDRLRTLLGRWEKLKTEILPSRLASEIVGALVPNDSLTEQGRLNVEQFLHLIAQIEKESPSGFSDVFRKLRLVAERGQRLMALELKSPGGGVKLMTIHAAKGLEFRRVFLPQLGATVRRDSPLFLVDASARIAFKRPDPEQAGGLKAVLRESPLFAELKKREETGEREEMKRLLYVAMTRARDELTLFLHEPARSRGRPDESSNWNDWLWTLLEEERKGAIPLTKEAARPRSFVSLAGKIEKNLREGE